nr:CapA family protein [Prevotella sp.]
MKILVAGDLLPFGRVAELFDQKRFEEVLGQVQGRIKKADYSLVNFECPICIGDETPIEKQGPNHKCSDSVIGALLYAGFNGVTLANNHFRDFGNIGCENTLRLFDANCVDHVGGGMDATEAAHILYKKVKGLKLAIINCCEHEFSIATKHNAGSNPLNPIRQYYDIREARSKADYVLVIVHGGHELWQLPSPRMKQTYQFFIDAGADAVVNHHQHCFSGYEIYKGKPVVYGLGNFCFDKQNYFRGLWEFGYMVEIETETNELTLYPYEQCKAKPTIKLMDERTEFDKQINKLNAIITDNDRLQEETDNYYA